MNKHATKEDLLMAMFSMRSDPKQHNDCAGKLLYWGGLEYLHRSPCDS
jgi:hypothetical protein